MSKASENIYKQTGKFSIKCFHNDCLALGRQWTNELTQGSKRKSGALALGPATRLLYAIHDLPGHVLLLLGWD